MMSRQWIMLVCMTALVGLLCVSPAVAQTPDVLYTWDQSYGESVGPDIEGWSQHFGGNAITLSNAIDGELTVTETDQTDWAITDPYDRIRESAAPNNYGGLDLTGLDSLEITIGHNGTETYSGQVYLQVPSGPNSCCSFGPVLGGISVLPGAPQTFSVPLSSLTADAEPYVMTVGVQMFDHTGASDGPLTWSIENVSSAGTPLTERYLSPWETSGDLDGAVVKFDSAAISGASDESPDGLGTIANGMGGYALRWVDLGGSDGAAIAMGNGRDGVNAVDYYTRPLDLRNYDYAEVRMYAAPGAGADSEVGVQFYMQNTDSYAYQSAGDLLLPVDGTYHSLIFPLSALADLDGVQWHGINLAPHAGNMDIRVDYVRFFAIPEPASVTLLGLAGCLLLFGWRTRR